MFVLNLRYLINEVLTTRVEHIPRILVIYFSSVIFRNLLSLGINRYPYSSSDLFLVRLLLEICYSLSTLDVMEN